VTFDHAVFSSLGTTSPSKGEWFGEGMGEVLVGLDLISGEQKGRMAIAWCYNWCSYDYFSCYKSK
jgi:hypothetical protein